MENSKPIPISLKIVASLSILLGLGIVLYGSYFLLMGLSVLVVGGEGAAFGGPIFLIQGVGVVGLGIIFILLGRGLLRLNRVWRLVALVITTVALILRTIGWLRWLISSDAKFTSGILPEIGILLIILWVFRVLLKSDVRALFKASAVQPDSSRH